MYNQAKGFTLIELLVVIAIVAILSVVVVLALNPAELLKQSRDSNRISDMATLRSALSLYLADVTTPTLAAATYTTACYVSTTSTIAANCGGRHNATATTTTSATPRVTTGLGWLGSNGVASGPNFGSISSGSPLGQLPLDPVNNGTYFYSYAADTTNQTFEIDAHMESTKYKNGGGSDVESTDGGNNANTYEVGTNLSL